MDFEIDPITRRRGSQPLESSKERHGDLPAQNGARLVLSIQIDQRRGDTTLGHYVRLPGLDLDTREALQLWTPSDAIGYR